MSPLCFTIIPVMLVIVALTLLIVILIVYFSVDEMEAVENSGGKDIRWFILGMMVVAFLSISAFLIYTTRSLEVCSLLYMV